MCVTDFCTLVGIEVGCVPPSVQQRVDELLGEVGAAKNQVANIVVVKDCVKSLKPSENRNTLIDKALETVASLDAELAPSVSLLSTMVSGAGGLDDDDCR